MTLRRYTIHPPQLVGRLSQAKRGEEVQTAVRRFVGEYDAAMQELQRFLRYLMDANDTGQTGSGIEGVVEGEVDHGSIGGLSDDDHTQYLKEKGAGGLSSEIPLHAHSSGAEAGQIDHGAANTAASLLDNDHPLYQRKHGFEVGSDGAAQLAITYNAGTRVVTLTPTGSTFRFWIDGVQFVKTGAQASSAHGTSTGLHYLTYDSSGALQWSTSSWSLRDRTVTPVALVYWNNTLSDGICFFEAHTADRVLEIHFNLHFSRGCQLISGFDLTGYTLATGSDAAVTYAIGAGVVADEDIRFSVAAISDGGTYYVYYRSGATGEWFWTAVSGFPFSFGTTYPNYNQWTGATWQLTEIAGGGVRKYFNYFLCATTAVSPAAAAAILIPGQTEHASLSAALDESLQSLSLGTLPFEEIAPLYRVTMSAQVSDGGTHKCRIERIASLKGNTVTVAGSSAALVPLFERAWTFVGPTGSYALMAWRAPYNCEVLNVSGYRNGGSGATINARKNGASNHLSSDLSLTSDVTWTDGGAVQNQSYVAGDTLEILLQSISGSPTEVVVQVDFRRL